MNDAKARRVVLTENVVLKARANSTTTEYSPTFNFRGADGPVDVAISIVTPMTSADRVVVALQLLIGDQEWSDSETWAMNAVGSYANVVEIDGPQSARLKYVFHAGAGADAVAVLGSRVRESAI